MSGDEVSHQLACYFLQASCLQSCLVLHFPSHPSHRLQPWQIILPILCNFSHFHLKSTSLVQTRSFKNSWYDLFQPDYIKMGNAKKQALYPLHCGTKFLLLLFLYMDTLSFVMNRNCDIIKYFYIFCTAEETHLLLTEFLLFHTRF